MADVDVGGWGWDEDEFRAAVVAAAALASAHLADQRQRPVFAPVPARLRRRWASEEWPDQGVDWQTLIDELREVVDYPLGNGHPRFHGWVNSPPDRVAVVAALLGAAANPSCAGGNHAALHIERQVVRWLAQTLGLPTSAGGLLVSGASAATIAALAAARQTRTPVDVRDEGLSRQPPLTVYASREVHSCVTKAVELLGLGRRNLRLLEPTQSGTLDPSKLERELREAESRDEWPIAVVASAGTVSRGAIDPLDEIAVVCAEFGVWLHVDGAYGAPAILSPRCRGALEGLALADSIALDPHKWLYVPVDAGVLIVREPEHLRETFSLVPPYLRVSHNADGLSDAPWMAEYASEQTRPFRALRVWAALKSTGRDGYRRLIDHDLDLARHLAARVTETPELVLDSVGLSIVCFHYGGGDDALQAEVARRVQLGGETFLTTTEIYGYTVLRACFVNPLTTRDDVDHLADVCLATARAVAAGSVPA